MKLDILTVFGLGRTRFSATTASIVAIIFYLAIDRIRIQAFYLHLLLFAIITAVSMYQLDKKKEYALSDPKEVVIDEFLGMYIALILPSVKSPLYIFILFVTFRALDILKPFPISWIEKELNNQYGLLFDDIFIGIFLGLALLGLLQI